jgi:hypothetical protein
MTRRPKKSSRTPGNKGRVTPKGTRPTGDGRAASIKGPPMTVRNAERDAAVKGRQVASRAPTGARPAGRGQR